MANLAFMNHLIHNNLLIEGDFKNIMRLAKFLLGDRETNVMNHFIPEPNWKEIKDHAENPTREEDWRKENWDFIHNIHLGDFEMTFKIDHQLEEQLKRQEIFKDGDDFIFDDCLSPTYEINLWYGYPHTNLKRLAQAIAKKYKVMVTLNYMDPEAPFAGAYVFNDEGILCREDFKSAEHEVWQPNGKYGKTCEDCLERWWWNPKINDYYEHYCKNLPHQFAPSQDDIELPF